MKTTHEEIPEDIFDDAGLVSRYNQATHTEQGLVLRFIFEAKDLFLGGLNGLREHPVGSLEIGSALAVTGLAAAAVLPRRHAHYNHKNLSLFKP